MNCYEYLIGHRTSDLSSVAVREGSREYSVRELFANIDSAAAYLSASGVSEGDCVSLALPNGYAFIVFFYALSKLGAVADILPSFVSEAETEKSISDHISKGIISLRRFSFEDDTRFSLCTEDFENVFGFNPQHANLVCAEKSFVYLYGGGTSGESHIVSLSSDAFNSVADKLENVVCKRAENGESCLGILPFFHAFGLAVCMHYAITHGFTVMPMEKFSASDASELIEDNNVSFLCGVPDMYIKLMNNSDFCRLNLKKLRYLFCGGDDVSDSFVNEFNTLLKLRGCGSELNVGYGLTETCSVCAVNTKSFSKHGSVGKPLNGVKISVVDENANVLPEGEVGEICVSGDTITEGYVNGDSPFVTVNGEKAIRTGDMGYLDKDGYLFFSGRKKRVMIVSGYNVYPADIEKVFSVLPFVRDVCAVEHNRKIVLYVAADGSDAAIQRRALEAEAEKHLPFYSRPTDIIFVDNLPKTKMGKTDYNKLKG